MMRIIAGKFRGRKLTTIRGPIRPTADRLRESLFNMLGQTVEDSTWLDLFCGSGAVGLEALSRGARLVVFNDQNPTARKLLDRNLELCGISHGFEIHNRDAFSLIRSYRGSAFDFIFLDPPYDFARYQKLLCKLLPSPVWNENTVLLLEIFKKTKLDFIPSELEITHRLQAGDSVILSLRQKR